MSPSDLPPPLPPKQPRGCLFYGCLTAIVLAIVAGVGGFFLVKWGLKRVVEAVTAITDTEAMPMPPATLPGMAYGSLEQRVNAFAAAIDNGAATPALVLSADEINALIERHPAWNRMRGLLHVDIQGDQLHSDVSFPIGDLLGHLPGLGELQGRYLNGHAELRVQTVGDVFVLALQSLTIRGQAIDEEIMRELRKQNLAESWGDTALGRFRGKLANVRVKDGTLVVEGRAK